MKGSEDFADLRYIIDRHQKPSFDILQLRRHTVKIRPFEQGFAIVVFTAPKGQVISSTNQTRRVNPTIMLQKEHQKKTKRDGARSVYPSSFLLAVKFNKYPLVSDRSKSIKAVLILSATIKKPKSNIKPKCRQARETSLYIFSTLRRVYTLSRSKKHCIEYKKAQSESVQVWRKTTSLIS